MADHFPLPDTENDPPSRKIGDQYGIRVNAVAPQLIDTAANRATFPTELLTHAVRPEAIANVIAFLAGDLAAPVSGAIVPAYGA
jgi:NAD(P)-dependent dehydrogenase (short-subunit alcohol dehydrogenase family)